MKVKELKKYLEDVPDDLEVYYPNYEILQPYMVTKVKIVPMVRFEILLLS